jgi:hypothetical protein
MRLISLNVFLWLALTTCVYAETIAAWNFNDAISGTTGGAQEFSVDYGSGIMSSNFALANIGNASGSDLEALAGDPAGLALRLNGSANNNRNLTWMTSTAGFDSIGISFAIQRTGTGFNNNQFMYSIDAGESWINFGNNFIPGTSFAVQSFDLSGIPGLINNPDAGFRIEFGGATSASGNNRIDNLIVSGSAIPTPVPESSTILLMSIGVFCAFLSRLRLA